MITRSFRWENENYALAKIAHQCFYGPNDDGGPSTAGMDGGNVDGGSGGMNMGGPASAPDVDPDVEAAINGALNANGLGFEEAGPNPPSSHPSRDPSIGPQNFDPSANPPGIVSSAKECVLRSPSSKISEKITSELFSSVNNS